MLFKLLYVSVGLLASSIVAVAADPPEQDNDYYAKTANLPSKEILKAISVTDFEITSKIRINVGDKLARKDPIRECEYANDFSIKALGEIPDVQTMVAVYEGFQLRNMRLLGEVKNLGGLTDNRAHLSLRVRVPEMNGSQGMIWVFMRTPKRVFANAINLRCLHMVH